MPHPELQQEQAYVDAAYERLDEIRASAKERAPAWARESTRVPGHQYDRDVSVRVALYRAERLDIGDESLVFGRTDADDGPRLYVGRRNVHSSENEPLVIDWRVPAAEPLY